MSALSRQTRRLPNGDFPLPTDLDRVIVNDFDNFAYDVLRRELREAY